MLSIYLSHIYLSIFFFPASSTTSSSDKFNGLVRGHTEYGAKYKGTLYLMSSLQAFYKFLRTPWLYANATLPRRLPPPEAPINLAELSAHGYLEQSLGKGVCILFSLVYYTLHSILLSHSLSLSISISFISILSLYCIHLPPS